MNLIWGFGDVKIWGCGDVKIWGFGDLEIWKLNPFWKFFFLPQRHKATSCTKFIELINNTLYASMFSVLFRQTQHTAPWFSSFLGFSEWNQKNMKWDFGLRMMWHFAKFVLKLIKNLILRQCHFIYFWEILLNCWGHRCISWKLGCFMFPQFNNHCNSAVYVGILNYYNWWLEIKPISPTGK